MKIRPATDVDRDAVWNIFHEVVAAGDTYALDPNISREDALAYWFAPDTHTYVAEIKRESVGEADSFPGTAMLSPTAKPNHVIGGTYILRPNPYEGCQR
jgi:hypothetical protein